MLRLGYVKYLNTLPLVHGLDALADTRLVAAVPSKLAPMLAAGEVDLALASTIDAIRSKEPLTLLPCGMIGCDGPTLTVRLFSAVPLERVTVVHADTDSHTSVALAEVLLAHRCGARPRIIDFDARERVATSAAADEPAREGDAGNGEGSDWPEALLMIGDKVVTDSPPAVRYPHQLDLGEAWKEWTGLPFVYALWMCRSADAGSPLVHNAAALLDRQRRRNVQRLDWIVSSFAGERRWPLDLARRYLGTLLRYEVGPREREAVARFFAEVTALRGKGAAASKGPAPERQVRWLDG